MKGKKGIAEDRAGVERLKERQARVEAIAEEKANAQVAQPGGAGDADKPPSYLEALQGGLGGLLATD